MTDVSHSADASASVVRHNGRVLAVAQAIGGANPSIVVALGGLVGQAFAPDPAYATVPVSLLQLGLAAGTIPAAFLMRRFGRRGGYLIGGVVGAVAGAISAIGIVAGSFGVFCIGTCLSGCYSSFVNSYRFAATDGVAPELRARAISWVMMGGIAAGIIGPQTVIWTRDLVPGAPFAGGFLGQGALALLSLLVLAQLRLPPPDHETVSGAVGRPLRAIIRQPRFVVAVTTALVAYGLMSLVMTAAPLAMVVECGLPVNTATLGIQWHILAMFAPSLLTGRLIGRFGKMPVTAVGLALIAGAALAGLSGRDTGHFWAALVLVGLGWNFAFIGATALVTECYRPEERAKVQAVNDFLVFGTVAVASFSSGSLLSAAGWQAVNWLVLPIVAAALGLLLLRGARDMAQGAGA